RRHVHGAVLLAAEGLRGVILHGNHLAGGHNLNRQRTLAESGQRRADHLWLADQENTHAVFFRSADNPPDPREGGVVYTHGIDSDSDHGILIRWLCGPLTLRPAGRRDTP